MQGRWASFGFVSVVTALGLGCDSPGGSPQQVAPGDTRDASEVSGADTSAPPDTGGGVDTQAPDTRPEVTDTAQPSLCALGCIPVSTDTAPRGVVFTQHPDGPSPALTGGAAPTGDWVLSAVDIHPNGTFAEGIEVDFDNAGDTAGRAAFGGDAIAMALDLHLMVTVTAFGSTGSDTAQGTVALGGCHEVEGARLSGTLATCAEGFPVGTTPPSSLDFELGAGSLAIGVELSRETLIGLLPVDQQEAAGLGIIGPLYLVATFERP